MKKPKLYIHIGTQKTGSTVIQKTLQKNKRSLKNEDIHYLGRYRKLARKMRTISDVDPQLNQSLCDAITKDIKNIEYSAESSFIISNEKFTGDKMIGYKNTGVIAKSLFEITKSLDLDVYIIVYLRRQDEFFESTYQQKVYSGETCTFEQFLNKVGKFDFHWDSLLESYADVFGKNKIIVNRYHKTYLPGVNSLIQNFGEVIGSDFLKTYENSLTENPGLTRDVVEITRITNSFLNKREKKQIRDLLKSVNSKNVFQKYDYFNPQLRTEYLSRYEETNAKVARRYFNNPSGTLFPPIEQNRKHKEYPGLNTETAVVTLTKAILSLSEKAEEMETDLEKRKGKTIKKKISNLFQSSPVFMIVLKKLFIH